MQPTPRTLALDVGDRRIGLAITDPLGLTAQPLFTLHRAPGKGGLRADLKAVARFLRQHRVAQLVVGLPLHADGSPSPQSEKSAAFAHALLEFVQPTLPRLTLHLLDERLTTRHAHALLDASSPVAGKAARLERSRHIDQLAAVLLLESFLSAASPTLLPDPSPQD